MTRPSKEKRVGGRPSLLSRQGSKSAAGAEVDIAPQNASASSSGLSTPPSGFDAVSEADSTATPLTSFRRKVDPHDTVNSTSSAGPSSSRPGDGSTRQYWLRKTDTLQSISIRFAVSTNELCLLNSLPRAVLSTSPHLLHTRSFILIPAHAVEKQLAISSNQGDLASSLDGPPQRSAREKTVAARRTAEAKFRAALSGKEKGATAADEKAARAYIGLAEDEFRMVNFGERQDGDGLPLAYDRDESKDKEMMKGKGEGEVMEQAQMDTARRLRFEAILRHALGKWEMDSDWERSQRANGLDPSTISKPLPHTTASSSSFSSDKEGASQSSKISKWFSRALNADPPINSSRGELRSPSNPPRHVVSLSSSVKLPTSLSCTFQNAHKGPVNVARYNSTGRYLLTGGSDRTVRLWNASSSGEPVKTYTEHNYEVLALDVSRDNSRFVSGGADKNVFVWDVASGTVVRRFGGFMGKVNDVRFGGKDADGSVVVVGGFDGVLRVFDLRAQGAWRPIMEMKEAKDAITSIVVRDDTIYSGSVDGCAPMLRPSLRTIAIGYIPCTHHLRFPLSPRHERTRLHPRLHHQTTRHARWNTSSEL